MRRVIASCSLLLVALAGAVHACTCLSVEYGPRRSHLASWSGVFIGWVEAMRDSFDRLPRVPEPGEAIATKHYRVATIRLERTWRGGRADSTVTFVDPDPNGGCSVHFSTGYRYLLYAHRDNRGFFSTTICDRSRGLRDTLSDPDSLGVPTSSSRVNRTQPTHP